MAPEMDTTPAAPAPFDFERIKSMVAKGTELAGQGIAPGTVEFNRQEGLDYHGFVAWRTNHSAGIDSAELDAVQAQAPVDPDVEPEDARVARVAAEGPVGERDDVRAEREAQEAARAALEEAARVAAEAPAEPAPGQEPAQPSA